MDILVFLCPSECILLNLNTGRTVHKLLASTFFGISPNVDFFQLLPPFLVEYEAPLLCRCFHFYSFFANICCLVCLLVCLFACLPLFLIFSLWYPWIWIIHMGMRYAYEKGKKKHHTLVLLIDTPTYSIPHLLIWRVIMGMVWPLAWYVVYTWCEGWRTL